MQFLFFHVINYMDEWVAYRNFPFSGMRLFYNYS